MGGLFLLTESRFLSSPIAELRTGPLGSLIGKQSNKCWELYSEAA